MHNDSARKCFADERKYALDYLKENKTEYPKSCLKVIEPNYYFESFSPGFLANQDDFFKKTKFFPVVNFNLPTSKTIYLGVGLVSLLDDKYAFYAEINRHKRFTDGQLAFPVIPYKTKNNRFSTNVSPVFYYRYFDEVDESSKQLFLNFGISISFGYHFSHSFYTGISYLYYLYNESHPNKFYLKPYKEISDYEDPYYTNQLDCSVYYQLVKGMSMKVGFLNRNPVIGITYVGNVIWYDLKRKSVGLLFNVY
jgi:hypothetical protein